MSVLLITPFAYAQMPIFSEPDSSDYQFVESSPNTLAKFTPRLILSAHESHSGRALPRWVSLKYDHINGRGGPGKHFEHLWTFKRRSMPVIVINEMDHWRKIRDSEGGESWVRSVALSKQKTAIVKTETDLYKSSKNNARITARLAAGVLLKLKECSVSICKVETIGSKKAIGSGYVKANDLWGTQQFSRP